MVTVRVTGRVRVRVMVTVRVTGRLGEVSAK